MHDDRNKLNPPSDHPTPPVNPVNSGYYPLGSAVFWIFSLYLPTILLSIGFAVYADINPNIIDPRVWFFDGDTTSLFTILMAFVTLPMLYLGSFREPYRQAFFALHKPFTVGEFRPYFLATCLYIIASVVIHTLVNTPTPAFMVDILNTTDYIWLSFLAICIVAPIFEELVFRGFIYAKLASTRLRHSGSILVTAILFTFVHSQYSGLVLVDLFILAMLLSITRYKTGNVYYCIAIHAINNMMSMLLLYTSN
ncbi:type II CAAX endopeptidase family protein [Thalassotalea sp. Y01]|uniref:CPBP family glutamic-type intramembrane protease n=1 Tax=Thalassotalea sp. Y01 TaxID=2729613 RepID=UPI00145DCA82|nr:CPBP family intramembrane metalloprotease [Thalassotalea sp. Y01]